MKYSTKPVHVSSRCLDCNESTRSKKPFCSDACKIHWLETHHPWHVDWSGAVQVENDRKRLGVTHESLEWKRRLSLSRPFSPANTLNEQLKQSLALLGNAQEQ